MACQEFNLACTSQGDFAIFQGATYNCVTFYYKDVDLSSYTPLGQIRDNYFQDGGNLLATFNFEPLTFGSVTIGTETFNATIIIPTLTAAETELLAATFPRSSQDADFFAGFTGWVYDIKLVGTTETVLVSRGFVEVIPDSSR